MRLLQKRNLLTVLSLLWMSLVYDVDLDPYLSSGIPGGFVAFFQIEGRLLDFLWASQGGLETRKLNSRKEIQRKAGK